MPRPDASQRLAATKPKNGPSKALIASVVAAVLVVVAVVAVFVVQSNKSNTSNFTAGVPTAGSKSGDGLRAYPNVKLKSGAPTVDIYEDFQCPICNDLEKANGSQILAKAKSGDIKLVWHMMTFLEDNLNNAPSSTIAANGLYCASDAGKAAEYHKANFAGQPSEGVGYTKAKIKAFGKQAGITGTALTTFNKCVDNGTYDKYVKLSADKASDNNVTGTPTLFINGKELSASKNASDYSKLLQSGNTFDTVLADLTK